MELVGIVVKGRTSASGMRFEGKSPGTIELQKPFFSQAGIDITGLFNGTINVSIAPKLFNIEKPDYMVTCKWSERFPEETFWLVRVTIKHHGSDYLGYWYYPTPSEIKAHQTNNVVELLCPKIDGLKYGDEVIIKIKEKNIVLTDSVAA